MFSSTTAPGSSSRISSEKDFFLEKKLFWFERKGFGRGGEFSSFLGQLGTQIYVAF